MSKLLPCPFCGGNDLSSGGDDKFVGYSCKTCQATGPNHYGSHEWNTRPTPAPCDVPELVRYKPHDRAAPSISGMLKDKEGDYVLYGQAAATIAAKDARIAELERHSCDNGFCHTDHWYDKAKTLEADNKRLREALETIAGDTIETRLGPWPTKGSKTARAALGGVKP